MSLTAAYISKPSSEMAGFNALKYIMVRWEDFVTYVRNIRDDAFAGRK